ncbi:unconventional myosin-IXa-like [Mauremys mutica]|uniref:unconventional myosin-IXa-like n=1 Tax=Mauremys mutica TaxID=74926 RepID=UPI001D1415FE|nr:unconventional myosin-IXa-like [Mauremys mutica]
MHGLYTEGIYRKSGSTSKIKELRQGLDTDIDNVNLDDYNIHVIASVFKQWLRDLPNPLMTFELYEEFLQAMGLQERKETIRGVYSVINQLSRTHLSTLERLIFHLVRIALQEETNRMSANALAIVFAPCILRCPDTTDPLQSVQDISKTITCVELIVVEQMNKYRARLKDINSLEFAENKAKSRPSLIRRSMTQETFHQFGSLIGAIAPYSCDSLATSRQWVFDCISCLLCIQGQPMNLGSAEEELRCLREELTAAPDPEALFQASSKMARVVSEYFPPEQATAFIEATVESMLSASPTCATAAGLWMKVILKECGDAMLDKVPAIVDIIYSHMATIQEGSLRQFLLEAVSILAHHHLEAVISSLLSNHLPMDSATSELWRSLGGEPLLATQVLQVLI